MAPAPTWSYSGANVTLGRQEDDGEEPCQEIQVHVKVEAFTAGELAVRAQQECAAKSRPDEMAEDGNQDEAEDVPTPSLQELGCTFSLQILGKDPEASEVLATPEKGAAVEEPVEEGAEEDEEAVAAREAKKAQRLLFHGDDGVFYHSFSCPASFDDETTVLSVCEGSIPSSIALLKEGQDAPLVMLPLDLAQLVAGERRVEVWCSLDNTELSRAPYNLKGFTVLVCSDKDVLMRSMRRQLNPMRITIVSAQNMPERDTSGKVEQSFQMMRDTFRPVFCRYNFLDTEVETHGVQQSKKLAFKASKVFCVGTRSASDLTDNLLQNRLQIRIFDRERIPLQVDLQEAEEAAEAEATEEGEDDEAKGKSPPPVWSGLKSIDKARAEEAEPPCQHGIASIDLSPLVKMASDRLSETAAIRPERNTHKSVYRRRLFPSAFLECETSLTVQVDLSFPLDEYREKGNFQRMILALPYADTERLWALEKIVLRRNCLALDGQTNVPLNDKLDPLLLKKSIGTVVLTEEQQADANLDIITGVQLIDGEFRIFVLEGLIKCTGYTDSQGVFTADASASNEEEADSRSQSKTPVSSKNAKSPSPEDEEEQPVYTEKDGAMIELLNALPRLNPNGSGDGTRIYWHPDLTFSTRLYGDFHADIRKVRLREPLRALLGRQEIAIQPKYEPSLNAMVRLFTMLRGTRSMKQVREMGGFPVPDMIVQMYKKFGAALTVSDIEGLVKLSLSEKLGADAELSAEEVLQAAQGLPGRPRRKAPTDSKNEPYQEFMHIRAEAGATDFVHANKETVAKMSEQAGLKGLRKFRAPADWVSGDLFQYGCQSLNFTDLHKAVVRERLKLDYGKVHYTYSKDFLSGAFVLQEPEDAKREEAAANKAKWLTQDGFRTIKASRPEEFRTHASEWGEWRRGGAQLMHDMDVDNLADEYEDPGLKLVKVDIHDLDMREAGLGSQRNPQRPLAQTVHAGVPFRRYFSQAAPQQLHLQGGVFGHTNPGFMDSVHTLRGGGEAERLTRIGVEEDTFNQKVKGDRKYMMALLKQPAKLSQIDRFNYPANRDVPSTHYGKTLKGPDGITKPFPVSMLSLQEKWCDPAETSTVAKYGVSLRYKADIDGSNKTCEWKAAKAVGVKVDQRQRTLHATKFDVRKVPPRDVSDAACNRIRFPPLVNSTSAGSEPWAPKTPHINPPANSAGGRPGLWAAATGPPARVPGVTPRMPTHDAKLT